MRGFEIMLNVSIFLHLSSCLISLEVKERSEEIIDISTLPKSKSIKTENAQQQHPTKNLPIKFPCKRIPPSPHPPNSVHRLRPGDIRVVAALGDSFTTGKAEGGHAPLFWLLDYRGLSWSVGGDEDFLTLQTLPNILREYNPDLFRFSSGVGRGQKQKIRLKMARDSATSGHLAEQARLLATKLKRDPHVDEINTWKVITIFIGVIDLCRVGQHDHSPEKFIMGLKSALDILHENVPRAFVNLVQVPPVALARNFSTNILYCRAMQKSFCPCMVVPKSEEEFRKVIHHGAEYQNLMEELVSSGIYDTSDNFTVVIQPFFRDAQPPYRWDNQEHLKVDHTTFTFDCLHLSRRGQARAGVMLWNNMLEPVGRKTSGWNLTMPRVRCPHKRFPYLATRRNSREMIRVWESEHDSIPREQTNNCSNSHSRLRNQEKIPAHVNKHHHLNSFQTVGMVAFSMVIIIVVLFAVTLFAQLQQIASFQFRN